MATRAACTRERTVQVGRGAPFQGTRVVSGLPVKQEVAGSIPAPGAMRAWRPDRQPAFFRRGTLGGFHTSRDGTQASRPSAKPAGSPRGQPLQVRVLSRALLSPWWKGNHASLRSSRCRFDSGRGCHGDVGQRKAAGPSTRKRWVQLPPSSPCPRSLIAWGADRLRRARTIAGGHGNPFRVPSSADQAPGYGPGRWRFESSRGCNGSGAGAQSRLIRATWRDRHPREPHSDRSVAQWEGRGPTNHRREFDSLRSDHSCDPARGSIWRGCPAVDRVRRVRFPSRAQTRCSSRRSGRSISGWLASSSLPTGTMPPRCCRRHARSVHRVGSRPALPTACWPAHQRGRAWEPAQGSHVNGRAGFEIPVAAPMRSWRKRQTHHLEGLARETSWEFDSPRAHQLTWEPSKGSQTLQRWSPAGKARRATTRSPRGGTEDTPGSSPGAQAWGFESLRGHQ